MRLLLCSLLLAAAPAASARPAPIDLAPYLRDDGFGEIALSPTGEYFAATVPKQDRTGLVVIRRADLSTTAAFSMGRNTHINDFTWVSNDRLVVAMAEQFGANDEPQATGELYAINADGKKPEMLVGFRVEQNAGTRVQTRREEDVAAYLINDLPADDRNVIVQVVPFTSEPWTRAERLDVFTGRRSIVARAPLPRASYSTDNRGVVRFARASAADNTSQLFHRASDEAEWTLVNDEGKSRRFESVIGFSADDRIAYLQVEQRSGPDVIEAYDTVTGKRERLLEDDRHDPAEIIYNFGTGLSPVGAAFAGDGIRNRFFDETSKEAVLHRMLEKSFPGQALAISSTTADGNLALVRVWSATSPGDYYLFDVPARKASHLLSRADWFDPDAMAPVRWFTFPARDGLEVDGLLTTPRTGEGKWPMVVMVHGGPFWIFDRWGFDSEVQMLARAGYAVLQVNFRGSGNRGRAFAHAGARQWGKAMQDDVTDATRWAIAQGHADPERICIAGASYGGYAAMMGLAKEPALYRCGVGYIGVYDLPQMVIEDGKISKARALWLSQWVGEASQLAAVSPTRLAGQIKDPVLLVAGGEDRIAPISHSRELARELKRHGTPVQTLFVSTEGHGFYEEHNRRDYYTQLLGFLAEHLGGAPAAPKPKD
mgnify:CR=1 FL=1